MNELAIIEPQEEQEQTLEDFLMAQLEEPVVLKDGTVARKADGSLMTKNEAIATNILNKAMKGDLDAAQYIINLQKRRRVSEIE